MSKPSHTSKDRRRELPIPTVAVFRYLKKRRLPVLALRFTGQAAR